MMLKKMQPGLLGAGGIKMLLAAAVVAGVAALSAGAAKASVMIYQDNFTGGSSTSPIPLDGQAPTQAPAGTTWTVNISNANGSNLTVDTNGSAAVFGGTAKGGDNAYAYLPITSPMLSNNSELTYSVTLTPAANGTSNWLAMGFGTASASTAANSGVIWALYRGNGGTQSFITAKGTTGGTASKAGTADTFTIALNTSTGAFTMSDTQGLLALNTNTNASGTLSNTDLSSISNIFIAEYANISGTAQSLSLSTPEPASLGLLAVGGLGLLLISRKRA